MKASDWTAPEGATFVCGACGKHGKQRDEIGDESCFMWAVLCDAASLVIVDGRVREAKAWK